MKNTLTKTLDNTPWTPRQVKYLLRSRNLIADDSNQNVFKIDCLNDHAFGGGRARISYDSSSEEWNYLCGLCSKEGLRNSLETLEEWLNAQGVDSAGLKTHYNPMLLDENENALRYLPDSQGRALLYSGLIHFLYGKPGVFKSWIALSLVRSNNVRFWDFENGVAVTGSRLKALGTPLDRGAVFDSPNSADAVLARVKEYAKNPPDIVCIDGFSGLAGVMEIDPDSNQDVLSVYTTVFAPLRRAGITVLVLDHLPKDSAIEDFPIGAQAKKSQADVAFLVKKSLRTDDVEIFVSKDRLGAISSRCSGVGYPRLLGTVSLEEVGEETEVRITPVLEASLNGKILMTIEARVMESIWRFVSDNPNCTKTDIERSVRGKNDVIRDALNEMVEQGYVSRLMAGKTSLHSVGNPLEISYRDRG